MRTRLGSVVLAAAAMAVALTWVPAASADGALTWSAPNALDVASPFGFEATPRDVSCTTASFCVEATENGQIDTTSDPVNGAWVARGELPGYDTDTLDVQAIACALGPDAVISCVVTDGPSGTIYVTSDPTGSAPTAWHAIHLSSAAPGPAACAATSSLICVVADGRRIWHDVDGDVSNWEATAPIADRGTLSSVTCPTSDKCFAMNEDGDVFQGGNLGTLWSPTPTTEDEAADGGRYLSCPVIDRCFSDYGAMGYSTSPTVYGSWVDEGVDFNGTLTGVECDHESLSTDVCVGYTSRIAYGSFTPTQAGSWLGSAASLAPSANLQGGSCAGYGSVTCVIVDNHGHAFATSDPSGGTAAWHSSNASASNAIVGISCPTAALCVMLDDAGRVATSTDLAHDAWTAPRFITGGQRPQNRLSCPSATLCVSGDDTGRIETTTDPVAGPWSAPVKLGGADEITALACTPGAPTTCVAADEGDVYVSSNPAGGAGAWTSSSVDTDDADVADVSCASQPAVLCVAVAGSDAFAITAGGSSSTADPGHQLGAVSCPSSSLCVAVDDAGNAVSSTSPATGPWTVTGVDGGGRALVGISCRTTPDTLCLATDARGNVLTATSPTGTWTPTALDANQILTAVSCDNGTRCVVGDAFGNLYVGLGAGALTASPTPVTPSSPVAPTPGPLPAPVPAPAAPSPPSAATLLATLRSALGHHLAPSGAKAHIGTLLKTGAFSQSFTATLPGTLTIGWYEAKTKGKPVLVAHGTARFTTASTKHIKITLTTAGKHLLKHAKHQRLTAKATFTAHGIAAPATAAQSFTLSR